MYEPTLEKLVVKPRTAAHLLDCGLTTVYELIKENKLETIDFGTADKRVTMASIKRLTSSKQAA